MTSVDVRRGWGNALWADQVGLDNGSEKDDGDPVPRPVT